MDGTIRRLTITRGQVAAKFGISERTFEKRRPGLEASGFPKKLPGFNAWSEPAVDDWFRFGGPAPIGRSPLDDARAELVGAYTSQVA